VKRPRHVAHCFDFWKKNRRKKQLCCPLHSHDAHHAAPARPACAGSRPGGAASGWSVSAGESVDVRGDSCGACTVLLVFFGPANRCPSPPTHDGFTFAHTHTCYAYTLRTSVTTCPSCGCVRECRGVGPDATAVVNGTRAGPRAEACTLHGLARNPPQPRPPSPVQRAWGRAKGRARSPRASAALTVACNGPACQGAPCDARCRSLRPARARQCTAPRHTTATTTPCPLPPHLPPLYAPPPTHPPRLRSRP
jgi:hypothetical protein